MRKLLLPAVALLALAACNKAQNEAAEANEQVMGDSNTMGEAVADVNAAEDAAFTAAENAYSVPANTVEDAEDANANEITD